MPVTYGLYATFLPLAIYGLLATSRQHVIGPDATLAALTAVTIAPLATTGGGVDPVLYAALAAALAVEMGIVLFAAGALRLGFVADFFGKPVLLGFINGVAFTVIASQLGKLFGISVASMDFFPTLREIASELGQANWPTVALSARCSPSRSASSDSCLSCRRRSRCSSSRSRSPPSSTSPPGTSPSSAT